MSKLLSIIVILLLTLTFTGCFFDNKINQNDGINRIYLENKYNNNGEFIYIKNADLKKLGNSNYILYTYNNYCSLPISCEDIFQQFMSKYNIDFLAMPFEEFKESEIYNTVKYAPSVIIIENGKVLAYLDANTDNDLKKYQDANEFEQWMNNYIYFQK